MPLLIDGHNLIPKIPGLSLDQIDDEKGLIQLLLKYAQLKKSKIEVFFDKGNDVSSKSTALGSIKVHYAHYQRTADDLIHLRLIKLGKNARNFTVISSDQAVLRRAREYGARTNPSDSFALELLNTINKPFGSAQSARDMGSSPQDIEYWLNQFSSQKPKETS